MIVAPSQTRPGDLALLKIPLTLAARKAPAFLQSDDCLENILSSPTPKELRLLISPPIFKQIATCLPAWMPNTLQTRQACRPVIPEDDGNCGLIRIKCTSPKSTFGRASPALETDTG